MGFFFFSAGKETTEDKRESIPTGPKGPVCDVRSSRPWINGHQRGNEFLSHSYFGVSQLYTGFFSFLLCVIQSCDRTRSLKEKKKERRQNKTKKRRNIPFTHNRLNGDFQFCNIIIFWDLIWLRLSLTSSYLLRHFRRRNPPSAYQPER